MPFNFQPTIFRPKMQHNQPCKYSRLWENLGWGRLFGVMVSLSLAGGYCLTFSSLNPSNLPENLPIVNMTIHS